MTRAKYRVVVERTVRQTTVLLVTAQSQEEAEANAKELFDGVAWPTSEVTSEPQIVSLTPIRETVL